MNEPKLPPLPPGSPLLLRGDLRLTAERVWMNQRRLASLPERDAEHERVQRLSAEYEARLPKGRGLLGSGSVADGYTERERRATKRNRKLHRPEAEVGFDRMPEDVPRELLPEFFR